MINENTGMPTCIFILEVLIEKTTSEEVVLNVNEVSPEVRLF